MNIGRVAKRSWFLSAAAILPSPLPFTCYALGTVDAFKPQTIPSTITSDRLKGRNLRFGQVQHCNKSGSFPHSTRKEIASSFGLLSRRMSSGPSPENEGRHKTAKVALLQFHVGHDKLQNIKTAGEYVAKAKGKGAELAVLPEIWNSPYATTAFPDFAEPLPNIGEALMSSKEEAPSVHFLVDAARKHEMWIIGGSIPEIVPASSSDKDSTIFNTCLCISPSGEIVAKHRKVHLFDIDVPGKITFRESDTLSGGSTISTFDAPFGKIGVGICYDIRFPEQAQCMIERGCKILVYPGAFNLTTGPAHWELLQRARAVDGQCFVLTASPARSDPPAEDSKTSYPHYSAWGHSTAVSPWGEVIATCDEKENMVLADLDMSLADEMRKSIPTTLQKRSDLYVMSDLTRK